MCDIQVKHVSLQVTLTAAALCFFDKGLADHLTMASLYCMQSAPGSPATCRVAVPAPGGLRSNIPGGTSMQSVFKEPQLRNRTARCMVHMLHQYPALTPDVCQTGLAANGDIQSQSNPALRRGPPTPCIRSVVHPQPPPPASACLVSCMTSFHHMLPAGALAV